MLLNDNLQSELQGIVEDAKKTCNTKELAKLATMMEETVTAVNHLFESLEEYLDASLYHEWTLFYEQLSELVEFFSGYIADDYGGFLDAIAMNVREELDDTGESDFGDKIDAVAQKKVEEQEEKKTEILESILNICNYSDHRLFSQYQR